MKKIFFVAMLFAFVGIATAQQKTAQKSQSTVSVEKNNNFEEWSKALNLSEKQKSDILAIHQKYEVKRTELRKTGNAEDFKKLNDDRELEINKLLTADQLKKAEQYKIQKSEEKVLKANIKPGQ